MSLVSISLPAFRTSRRLPPIFMPHPVYGKMHWVCVLNPSAATFAKVQELLAEAYEMAVGKRTRAGQG